MSNENELLEPLATEAGQLAIARAINNLSSLEYAVRAERAATTATQKADEALNSADDASDYATEARNWATKTDGYVAQETITIPPEQEGDDPTTETIDLYSARYYAALALDIYNNLQFDTEPTENSTNLLSSGAIYTALSGKADKSTTYTKTETDTLINTKLAELVSSAPATLDTLQELATALGNDPNFATTIATQLGNKADKSDTYTKTEVDTALSNVQSTLTFDNVPTANSDNPVKSSGIKTALDGKQNTLTFDSTPTANSNNPVTSGGVYTALQNVNIDIDDEITEDSDNPVTSAAIYDALRLATQRTSIYELNTPSYEGTFNCDLNYYVASAVTLYTQGRRTYYKYNNLPAICGMGVTSDGWAGSILISLDADAVKQYSSYNTSDIASAQGTITYLGKEWYWSTNMYGWQGTDYSSLFPTINTESLPNTYGSEELVLALLVLSGAYLTTGDILELLFNPTNYTLTSGDTISNNILLSLISYFRPIKINGETYYPIKLDNGTYYYEGKTNTITIDSSWVITITPKNSGGGSSVTVDSTITQNGTNPVEGGAIYTALGDKADKSTTYTKTEVDTAISSKGDVTTDTNQNITGTKTFVGSKKVAFKLSAANDKLGFTLYSNSNAERGYLEFNPTNTVDGVAGLMTLGNYATSAASLTQVGFRRYSNISGASGAYNLLMPMVADARTPFSLTTTYLNFYLPLGFKNGSTIVKTDKSGVVDISSLLASLEARVAALEGN